jgi:transposase-like protein
MFGRETRMLLRHYLEQGTSKSALARKLGVHRDTIHRWIRAGELDRDLDGEPVRYGPRRRSRPDWMRTDRSSKRGSPRIHSCRPCGSLRRFGPRAMQAATPS